MPLYVVQMFYATLKESAPLVAEAKSAVAALSKNDFILMGFGEHTSAIAFVQPVNAPSCTSASRAQLASFSTVTRVGQRPLTRSIMLVPALNGSAPPLNITPVVGFSSPQQLIAMPDIDGALVGGASLEADDFAQIVRFGD